MALTNFLDSFAVDVARPSRFDVNITVPALLTTNISRQLILRCEHAELPGRTFGTIDQKFGSNPTSKFPTHTSYNDLVLTFIVSDNMSEKNYFDAWMEYINPISTFDFNYKGDFASSITITQYDLLDNPSYVVNLFNAYPIDVNQLDLDWSSDGHHKLTVVFAYDYWQNQNVNLINLTKSLANESAATIPVGSDSLFGATIASSPFSTVPNQQPFTLPNTGEVNGQTFNFNF
jgi:hypothetical protein